MARVKIIDASGPALDWLVGIAEGVNGMIIHHGWAKVPIPNAPLFPGNGTGYKQYRPSGSWRIAGPIIWRENISLSSPASPVHRTGGPNAGNGQSGVWTASTWHKGVSGRRSVAWDTESPIVAAMRAYAISKLGDEAEVPYDLLLNDSA